MSLKFLFKNTENKSQKVHVIIQDQKIQKLNFKEIINLNLNLKTIIFF
jgi:hypothetical protein